jgi:hypothetical protein
MRDPLKKGLQALIIPLKMPFQGFFMPPAMRAVIDFYGPYTGGIIYSNLLKIFAKKQIIFFGIDCYVSCHYR